MKGSISYSSHLYKLASYPDNSSETKNLSFTDIFRQFGIEDEESHNETKKMLSEYGRTSTTFDFLRDDIFYIREHLKGIYAEMRTRQRNAIEKAGSMKPDNFFSFDVHGKLDEHKTKMIHDSPKIDSRRCFAVSAKIDKKHGAQFEWSPAYKELQRCLQKIPGVRFVHNSDSFEDDEYVGQLHWTLMQLVGFSNYDSEFSSVKNKINESESKDRGNFEKECPFVTEKYLSCVKDALIAGGIDRPITINFVGVIAVSTGLLMVGIPSIDSNGARDNVRRRLKENNLPLLEPFLNDIVHSTLFRVVPINNNGNDDGNDGESTNNDNISNDLHKQLLEIANKYENINLGTVTLNTFQIGPASYRMRSAEMIQTQPLMEWTLPPKDAKNKNNIDMKKMINHDHSLTITGAGGANLAKELMLKMRVLSQ